MAVIDYLNLLPDVLEGVGTIIHGPDSSLPSSPGSSYGVGIVPSSVSYVPTETYKGNLVSNGSSVSFGDVFRDLLKVVGVSVPSVSAPSPVASTVNSKSWISENWPWLLVGGLSCFFIFSLSNFKR
jgi:hypothetical protein